jgi:photosystem II stability/assembly factor-like uncharacterized protein
MKKFFLFALALLGGNLLVAQPWMPANLNGPLKYADVLDRYRHSPYFVGEDDAEGPHSKDEKESRNHLFEVWNYYWSHHLDQNGYMVPPVKTLTEWQNYMAAQSNNHNARTTIIPANWVFQGPDTCTHGYSGLGRINTVAFDPIDSNTFYIGSAAGSTWKTTNGGHSWTSCYDNLPTLGVADIKINPLNHNTVYVATGDGDAGDAYSSGVIVSHNGGLTWSTTGLNWLPTVYNSARSLLINPVDTTKLMLASNAGIFKTYNSGLTWINVYNGNFKQILYKPGDTNTVYGTMYTDTSAQIMLSTDGGNNWNPVTSFTDAQRINIAVCPAMPNLVQAVASDNSSGLKGIYTSVDNGATYTATYTDDTSCTREILGYDLGLPTSHCGGQGWYDLCIAINPTNPADLIVGGVNTYYSSDTGATWQIANQWYGGLSGVATVHADKHCLAYHPLTGATFETCDGGVYKNYGPLTSPWTDLTDGIHITEFYRVAVNNNVPFSIGGCQDNGTKMVYSGQEADLTGGDGMQPLINYGDPSNMWYCAYQNGSVDMTRDGGISYHSITDTIHSSGSWVTPYVLHPSDTGTLFIGMYQIFESNNNGLSWSPISPVFDSNATMDRLAISLSNPNYLYTTYYNYNVWEPKIFYTSNSGATWDSIIPPFNNYISDLVIDPTDEKRIWVTISAYGVGKIFQYNGATGAWADQTGTLPDIPVECMVIDTNSKTKYIGTDAGIYYKDTLMTDWALYNTNLPTVHVDDLNINYRTNEIWAATFGRGMWKSVKADHTPVLESPLLNPMPGTITISPNPNQGIFNIKATGNLLHDKNVTITISSADGKTAWQTTGTFDGLDNIKINTNGLPAGFYICELSNNAGTTRSKVVIY